MNSNAQISLNKWTTFVSIILLFISLNACSAVQNQSYELFQFNPLNTELKFDNQFVSINEMSTLQTETNIFKEKAFTLDFWYYPESNFNWSTLISIGDLNNFFILSTRGNPDGKDTGLNIAIKKEGYEIVRALSNHYDTVKLNQYNHIALTYQNHEISLYLNGSLVAKSKINFNIDYLSDYPTQVASRSFFNDPIPTGFISNITLSTSPLSEQKIQEYYDSLYLDAFIESLKINETDDLTSDIFLPNFENSNLMDFLETMKWSSSNEKILSSTGEFNNEYKSPKDENIILTLEVSDGSRSVTREFHFKHRNENNQLRIQRDVTFLNDYSATFEPLVSLELCQLFRQSCATQFG